VEQLRAPHPWVAAGRGRIRFGVTQATWESSPEWDTRVAFVRAAEALGLDSYWAADHPTMQPDCFTTLAGLATATSRIRLGTLVCCVHYRSATLLARQAADVDRISRGRLVLGLGIGWVEQEFADQGLPFLPLRDRQRALDETVATVRRLWAEGPAPPVQRPRVPIVIAGGGERVTLRQVAEHGDVSNFGGSSSTGGAATLADVERKLAALRGHCRAFGRPYESILKSHAVAPIVLAATPAGVAAKLARLSEARRASASLLAGTPDEVIAYYRPLAAAGLEYFIGVVPFDDHETLELLAERVVPALQPG
jgi:alkanesulfonate monooxygenase SsuD/methylene tetrahydromethanopterin reductase-like flavin-dependent oxidoreductase (luciferase family)